MMYDNLSNRLRGEAEVSDAAPYIKELMKQAADALDHFENITRAFQALPPSSRQRRASDERS
jgi:hypothetical protein